jgi:hypothetical protein
MEWSRIKMKALIKNRNIFIVLLFLLICLQTYAKNSIVYINKVEMSTAQKSDMETYTKFISNEVIPIKIGEKYNSKMKSIYAVVRCNGNETDSFIDIKWNKFSKTIHEKNHVSGIYWRPSTNDFIFGEYYPSDGDEGDTPSCTINYVHLELTSKGIEVKKIIRGSPQESTYIGWSSDGKYYAYSQGSSLRIKNFITGKIWASKSLELDHGTTKSLFLVLGDFLWVDHDQKLILFWKNHPFYEKPAGVAVVDLKQFRLN